MNSGFNRGESALRLVVGDFQLSRVAMGCTKATLNHYKYTAGGFTSWLEGRGVCSPDAITAQQVREYLAWQRGRGLKDTSCHAHARGIKALLRFLHSEGYIPSPIRVVMPHLDRKRMPTCTDEDVHRFLRSCTNARDKALLLLMIDTGLRLEETVLLRWDDLDLKTGLVHVQRGKGGKARTVIIGAATRHMLSEYREACALTWGAYSGDDAIWVSHRNGTPLTKSGVSLALRRIGRRAGRPLSPHMLRRTFATLSIRLGMNPVHLQALLGHSTLAMTQRYLEILDDDLQKAHENFGPVNQILDARRSMRRISRKG